MSRCKNCNVDILDHTDKCPFCKCVLDASSLNQEATYPDALTTAKKFRLAENIVLFVSILIVAVSGYCNYLQQEGMLWSVIVALSLFYANVILRLAVIGKSSYMFKTVFLTVAGFGVICGIDFVTGYHAWSFNYVLPSGILLWDLGIVILMIVNHRNWQSYLIPQMASLLMCLISLVMYWNSIITVPYMTYLATAVSGFLFLGTVIIGDKRARAELYRRFHI